jgi:hypothetical protein
LAREHSERLATAWRAIIERFYVIACVLMIVAGAKLLFDGLGVG